MFGMSADVRFSVKAVEVVVGMVKLTVSTASSVDPAAAEYAVVLFVLRSDSLNVPEPVVTVLVFNTRVTQSI